MTRSLGRIVARHVDITTLACDAIINAANESLLGGGGVDGAIHRAAGPALVRECAAIGSCPTGQARLTGAYQLPARHVIHTVGPVWQGGSNGEAEVLAQCYRACFALANQHALCTLAFPAISCGVYGYPWAAATAIAVDEVQAGIQRDPHLTQVIFACFSDQMLAIYGAALTAAGIHFDD